MDIIILWRTTKAGSIEYDFYILSICMIRPFPAKFQLHYWSILLESPTGVSYWSLLLESPTGVSYLSLQLESSTGVSEPAADNLKTAYFPQRKYIFFIHVGW